MLLAASAISVCRSACWPSCARYHGGPGSGMNQGFQINNSFTSAGLAIEMSSLLSSRNLGFWRPGCAQYTPGYSVPPELFECYLELYASLTSTNRSGQSAHLVMPMRGVTSISTGGSCFHLRTTNDPCVTSRPL